MEVGIFADMKYFLREWMTLRHLSQPQLARLSGVTQPTISDMVNNPEARRQDKIIGKLCAALGISPEDLKRRPTDEEWESVGNEEDSLGENEDEIIDSILAIRYRGDLSEEGVRRLTNELIKSLYDERSKGRGSSTAPDTESP